MGSAGNANAPSSAVMYVLLKPVSLFKTVTLDCGTEAPVVSTTMPLKLAVVNCARQGEKQKHDSECKRSFAHDTPSCRFIADFHGAKRSHNPILQEATLYQSNQ